MKGFSTRTWGTVGKGKGVNVQVKPPLWPPGSSTHSQSKAQVAKSRSLPWGWSPVGVPPSGLGVRGGLETFELKSWLHQKKMGILLLLQMQHPNSATQCSTLKFTIKLSEYPIFYLEKCSKF